LHKDGIVAARAQNKNCEQAPLHTNKRLCPA
jgi:hypothetical protein